MTKVTHTENERIEIVRQMWDAFNKLYFGNKLPRSKQIHFKFEDRKDCYGSCQFDDKMIMISSYHHVTKIGNLKGQWTNTLLHEMLHFYDRETANLSPNQMPHAHGFYLRERRLLKFRFPLEQLDETYLE